MCSKLLKVFSILAVVCFVFSVTCCTANAVFYEEDDYYLLEYAGIYGGYWIYFYSDDLYNAIDYGDLVIWIPNNYKDNFSSDSHALVNISSSSMTLRAYDADHGVHTIRVPAYSYMQIRTDYSPYQYYDITDMTLIDTNVPIKGEGSPFFNSNLQWSEDAKCICFAIGLSALLLVLVGVFHDKSRC